MTQSPLNAAMLRQLADLWHRYDKHAGGWRAPCFRDVLYAEATRLEAAQQGDGERTCIWNEGCLAHELCKKENRCIGTPLDTISPDGSGKPEPGDGSQREPTGMPAAETSSLGEPSPTTEAQHPLSVETERFTIEHIALCPHAASDHMDRMAAALNEMTKELHFAKYSERAVVFSSKDIEEKLTKRLRESESQLSLARAVVEAVRNKLAMQVAGYLVNDVIVEAAIAAFDAAYPQQDKE